MALVQQLRLQYRGVLKASRSLIANRLSPGLTCTIRGTAFLESRSRYLITMLHTYYYAFLSACLYLALTESATAQKNFFEVPSGEIVERQKLFFQTQAVLTRNEVNAMTGVTYGLGLNTELGLALNQWDFQRGQGLRMTLNIQNRAPIYC